MKLPCSPSVFTRVALLALLCTTLSACRQAELKLAGDSGFGSNPGKLQMFSYVPQDVGSAPRPLVVALHGCAQRASSYDDESGWVKLADQLHFSLLLPQQQAANHPFNCFRWFDPQSTQRDKGEALSIKQMIDSMKTRANIDPARIYITGLSAGGAMTAVMLATYPEVFAGGAMIAGIAYRCAENENAAQKTCGVLLGNKLAAEKKNMTAVQWGDLVRQAVPPGTVFPKIPISIWHGDVDGTVDPQNQTAMMKQWTDVLGIDQVPDVEEVLNGNTTHPVTHRVYADAANNKLLETYLVKGMDHGTPVDPHNVADPCGSAQSYILDVGFCSSRHIARSWGLEH